MACDPLNITVTPAGRVETCAVCGAPLELEMEFDAFTCTECQRDIAELHTVVSTEGEIA